MNYRIYVDIGSNQFAELPVPQGMDIGLQDISSSNAGRTESTLMMKERIGKAPRFDIHYTNVDSDIVSTATSLVSAEYFNLLYPDWDNGGNYAFGQFYRGDVSLAPYNGELDIWSKVSFSLIKRDGKQPVQATVITQTEELLVIPRGDFGDTFTYTVIPRKGTISVDAEEGGEYVAINGANAEGTVIFRSATNQITVVNVKG